MYLKYSDKFVYIIVLGKGHWALNSLLEKFQIRSDFFLPDQHNFSLKINCMQTLYVLVECTCGIGEVKYLSVMVESGQQ